MREAAGDRLQRLLAVVPWLCVQGKGATAEEIVERFGGTVGRLETDLSLLANVEPMPFCQVKVYEDDGRWFADPYGEHLTRPVRLTKDEGVALVVTMRAALAISGGEADGPLADALVKIETSVGGLDGLEVNLPTPDVLRDVQAATEAGASLEIGYYSPDRDAVTTRVVEPLSVYAAGGYWYLIAYCHTSEAERRFRVDRIRALRQTGEMFERREPTLTPGVAFDPGEAARAVRIELSADHRWVVETYPVTDVEELDHRRLRATLHVVGTTWLERLLVRLGPEAVVLDPPDLADVGVQAAARLLERYR